VVPMLDLEPATDEVAKLVTAVRDDQLTGPTPCAEYSVAALLDHLMALAIGFKLAALKTTSSPEGQAELTAESRPGAADAAHLQPDWRTLLPARLRDLSAAWKDPAAWDGETEVGGVTLPAEVVAKVGANELVQHGWDLARATGQEYSCDAACVEAAFEFTSMLAQPGQEATRDAIFGPAVDVSPDAPLLDRTLALGGRDPSAHR
jgi:uncharacterized protein (TIGR03086 family)